MEVNIDTPIFIVGVGRSGTTLLQSILDSHKQVTFTPETHFLRFYLDDKKIRNRKKVPISQKMKYDQYLKRLVTNIEDIVSYYQSSKTIQIIDVYKYILYQHALIQKKSIVGDKDPKNVELLHLIQKHFPHAYVIHMIRDPRDVLVSRMKADWSRGRSIYAHILAYKVQSWMGIMNGPALFGNRYFEVKYEQLLDNPEETVKFVCSKLNVEYNSSMLKFQQSAQKLVSKEEMQWKKESLGPLLKQNTGKWKDFFSKEKIALIERTTFQNLAKYGYKTSGSINRISILSRLYIEVLHLLLALGSKLYILFRTKSVKKI